MTGIPSGLGKALAQIAIDEGDFANVTLHLRMERLRKYLTKSVSEPLSHQSKYLKSATTVGEKTAGGALLTLLVLPSR